MSSTATVLRTPPAIEHDWRRTELMMNSWSLSDLDLALDLAGDLAIDDLDHPAAVTAAFTYCG